MALFQNKWFCPACKSRNPSRAKYCGSCGTKKEVADVDHRPKILTAIICIAVMVLVAAAAFELGRRSNAVLIRAEKIGTDSVIEVSPALLPEETRAAENIETPPAFFSEETQPAEDYDTLFDDFLKVHSEFMDVIEIDLNGDGVNEKLVVPEDDPRFPMLCAVSRDGKRINRWLLSSRWGDVRYDEETSRLAVHSGGTGRSEYCFLKLLEDELEVWHVGGTSTSQETYFYAFTERIPGKFPGFGVPSLHYSFGELYGNPPGRLDMDFLDKNEISAAEFRKWEDRYYSLPCISGPYP